MIWVAFSLGFFGSLHCLGMCGPLAMGVVPFGKQNMLNSLSRAFQYNIGRVIMYSILGGIFGLVGQAVNFAGFQKTFSVVAGFFLVLLFMRSLDLERLFFRSDTYQKWYRLAFNSISRTLSSKLARYPVIFGFLNGILPCGLVYLALSGSLTTGHVWLGVTFMLFFGLGTFPAMAGIMLGAAWAKPVRRLAFNKVVPVLHLLLGLLLIYRGWAVDVPMELDFWTAIKFPVMCH